MLFLLMSPTMMASSQLPFFQNLFLSFFFESGAAKIDS